MTTLLTETRPIHHPVLEQTPAAPPVPADKPARLMSLDAYRGFIMLVMASGGLAIPRVAKTAFPDSPFWSFLAFQTDHVPWIGCSFWDLIQPSFMFMVGVALPYSYASRKAKGESETRIFWHTLWRSLVLILLGIFLSSNGASMTNFTFVNVLTQIGLGYAFLYLLVGRGLAVQLGVTAALLVGYTLYFGLWQLPGPGFDYRAVGVPRDWNHLTGWFAHWDKNTNAAAWFDERFLNLFPRPKHFDFNDGGYQTLNFIPSLATMILGLVAGEWLRCKNSPWNHLAFLMTAGAVCLVLGLAAGNLVVPIVKRIWTPSWALYSAGWTFWMLAAFYFVIDLQGWRRWAFPFVVVGMNSIAMYCMAQLMKGWVAKSLKTNLGGPAEWLNGEISQKFGLDLAVYAPIIESAAVLLVLWLICLWLYRRKLFLKV